MLNPPFACLGVLLNQAFLRGMWIWELRGIGAYSLSMLGFVAWENINIMHMRAMSDLVCSFLHTYAASGAAITPPRASPRTISHWTTLRAMKKVVDSTVVTKNSARFAKPMTSFGLWFLAISVEPTLGLYSPPPTASRNSPNPPKSFCWMGISYREKENSEESWMFRSLLCS